MFYERLETILADNITKCFSLLFSSNWAPSEVGLADYSHVIISEFDFMVSQVRKQLVEQLDDNTW